MDKSETFELIIKDGEGRLWNVITDANRDIVGTAIKFLREMDNKRMVELINLLESYNYSVEANLLREPNVDFEM